MREEGRRAGGREQGMVDERGGTIRGMGWRERGMEGGGREGARGRWGGKRGRGGEGRERGSDDARQTVSVSG